jgi:hypothetical protein
MARGRLGLYHDVQSRQRGTLLPEAFADCALDPVAPDRARDRLLGNRDPQPGDPFSTHCVNVETGIRNAESLSEGSGEFRRYMQPGCGWKSGAGLA